MRYPLPWFPLSDDPSRYRYRTTAGCRPCRSSPWDVAVVAVEVVHFLRLSFVFGIGDGAHGGWLAHAGCLFSAVDLTVLPCGIWCKSLPRFILKRCSGHMQCSIERAARTRKNIRAAVLRFVSNVHLCRCATVGLTTAASSFVRARRA